MPNNAQQQQQNSPAEIMTTYSGVSPTSNIDDGGCMADPNSPSNSSTQPLLPTSENGSHEPQPQQQQVHYPLDVVVKEMATSQALARRDKPQKRVVGRQGQKKMLPRFDTSDEEEENEASMMMMYNVPLTPSNPPGEHHYQPAPTILIQNEKELVQPGLTGLEKSTNHPPPPTITDLSSSTTTGNFKKGHRRAFSMPAGAQNKEKKKEEVLTKKEVYGMVNDANAAALEESSQRRRRRVVRYRLHPWRGNCGRGAPTGTAKETRFIEQSKFGLHPDNDEYRLASAVFPPNSDNDGYDDLDLDINEEEIMCFGQQMAGGSRFVTIRRFWEHRWRRQNFELLPEWLQDNEYLRTGHRPQLDSFGSCFKSIFSLHTETGNIWTHMYGCVAFMGVAAFFLTRPHDVVGIQEKLVFAAFFMGAILCMGLSFAFHTFACHSQGVGRLFSKLDYSGISLLIIGSFIPWIYYGFYCRTLPKLVYISMIVLLGMAALVVSLFDRFARPAFRPVRATVFVAMGLSSVVPAMHLILGEGLEWMLENASFHWLVLMGVLYLVGAGVYAARFPERCFPGKCDIWFHSHQLFHLFVVVAAFVHFYGITEMAMKRLEGGSCREQLALASTIREGYLARLERAAESTWIGSLRRGLDEKYRPY